MSQVLEYSLRGEQLTEELVKFNVVTRYKETRFPNLVGMVHPGATKEIEIDAFCADPFWIGEATLFCKDLEKIDKLIKLRALYDLAGVGRPNLVFFALTADETLRPQIYEKSDLHGIGLVVGRWIKPANSLPLKSNKLSPLPSSDSSQDQNN